MKTFLQQIREGFDALAKTNDIIDDQANWHDNDEEFEEELEEQNVTGAVAGFDIPAAFSKRGAEDDTVEVLGYKRVKESVNTAATYKFGQYQTPESEEEEWCEKFPFAAKPWHNEKMKYPSIDLTDTPSMAKKQDVPKLQSQRPLADIVHETIDAKYEQLIESYRNYKTSAGDKKPSRTVKETITDIARRLKEIEEAVNYASRFKNESGVTSTAYGPSTTKALTKISERLIKISERVRTLGE